MSRLLRPVRRAFTLIELLVAMSVIVVLSALVLMVVVNIGDRDGTTDAAGLTRQWLMIAKARAARDQAPRGIRLVIGTDPNNIAKTSPFWVTEVQYIEAPPILITYPAQNGNFAPSGSPTDPAVLFTYTVSPGVTSPYGTIISKTCQIVNLRFEEAIQVVPNSVLQLPVIGTWHRITGVSAPTESPPASGLWTVTVTLDAFPDAPMGAAGTTAGASYVTQLFGITSPPRPLMAEPPLQLPKNICIDVSPDLRPPNSPPAPAPPPPPYFQNPSVPGGIAGTNYDILFSPNGHVLPVGMGSQADGSIFLWHRDYTKIRNLTSPLIVTNTAFTAPFPPPVYDMTPFQNGGEQQIVAIKTKTGSLGQFPVLWPNAGGQYNPGDDPYTLARLGATAP